MQRGRSILLICGATVLGVASLAIAVSAIAAGRESYAIGSVLSALAMGLVILGQVFRLRKQGKTAE
jgi:hypothetical protein